MAKPRLCPNCRKNIPIDHGFSFDKQLNLICGKCNKIAFPASEQAENSSKPASNNSYTTYSPTGGGVSHGGGSSYYANRHWGGGAGASSPQTYMGREE